MWQNVGKSELGASWGGGTSGDRQDQEKSGGDQLRSRNKLIIHVDCRSADRGLFAGLLVLVTTVVSVFFFFLAFSDQHNSTTAIWVNLVSESTLLVLMTLADVLTIRLLGRSDADHSPFSFGRPAPQHGHNVLLLHYLQYHLSCSLFELHDHFRHYSSGNSFRQHSTRTNSSMIYDLITIRPIGRIAVTSTEQ